MDEVDKLEMKYVVLKLEDDIDIKFLLSEIRFKCEEWDSKRRYALITKTELPPLLKVKDISLAIINSVLRVKSDQK